MPEANLGDVRINFRFDGPADAPVVVLSSSLGCALAMWEPQVAALAGRFRVLRYDSRGHGASSTPAGPYTIDQMGADVLALLDYLGIEHVRFCGLSMGGMVGMWLGRFAPARLARLVLCNTAARIGPPDAWNARIEKVNEGGMRAIADVVAARWFSPAFFATQPPAVKLAREMLQACDPQGYVAACAAVRDMDQRDGIGDIAVPTLVVAGTHDVSTPPPDGRFLAERIGGARYVELDTGHLSNLERPQVFNAAVAGFLGE
jgi:3-oxoadipate enol-lactonase